MGQHLTMALLKGTIICPILVGSALAQYSLDKVGWKVIEGLGCRRANGGGEGGEKFYDLDLSACIDSCKAVPECEGVTRRKKDGTGPGFCGHKHQINLEKCKPNPKNDIYIRPDDQGLESQEVESQEEKDCDGPTWGR